MARSRLMYLKNRARQNASHASYLAMALLWPREFATTVEYKMYRRQNSLPGDILAFSIVFASSRRTGHEVVSFTFPILRPQRSGPHRSQPKLWTNDGLLHLSCTKRRERG